MTPVRAQALILLIVVAVVIASVFLFHEETRRSIRRVYWTDERILRKATQQFPPAYRVGLIAFLRHDAEGNLVLNNVAADALLKSKSGKFIRGIVANSTRFDEYKNLGTMDEHDENVNLHDRTIDNRSLRLIAHFVLGSKRQLRLVGATS